MKVRFNHWYNTILTALLTLLGYGCSATDEPLYMYGSIVEYGTPYADYQISGTVTDEKGTSVKDIKVAIKYVYQKKDGTVMTEGVDSTTTNGSGKYAIENRRFISDPSLKLIVEDIDGEANGGAFKSDTINIDYENAKKVKDADKGEHWNNGTFAIQQDIKLKKK